MNTFYIESLQKINEEIDTIWENTKKVRNLGGSTEPLDAKRTRLMDLRHNLGKIIANLQNSLVGDFSDENKINANLPKLIDLINA